MTTFALQNAQQDLLARRPNHNGPKPLSAIAKTAVAAPPAASEDPKPERTVPLARLGELETDGRPLLTTAIKAARAWQKRRREQAAAGQPANASLVLLATAVPNDRDRTGYGCGKTHIARACLWSEAYMVGDTPIAPAGRFFLAADILARLDGETRASDEVGDAPIIVLDDVGAEGVIRYVRQDHETQTAERHARYFKLLDFCCTAGKGVIITGNLRPDDLAAHIGGRAWSRLMQMAPAGYIVDLTGTPDYRRHSSGR
jgi:hypothetical protein